MRHLSFMAALVGVSLIMNSAPAFATDQAGAIKLCAANPNCGLTRGQGGVQLWVDLGTGGTEEIWCPDKGECVCQTCTGGGGGGPARWGVDLGHKIRPRGWSVPQSLSEPSSSSGGAVVSTPAPAPTQQPPIL